MFDGFQLHLICLCPFTRQDILALEIAVHHDDYRFIIIEVADNDRHGVQACQLTGTFSPVSSDDLIPAILHRTRNGRHQHPIRLDALHGFHHAIIIHDAEWVIFEWMQLRKRDLLNLFPRICLPCLLRGKEIIV